MVAVHPAQRRRIEEALVEIARKKRGIDLGESALKSAGIVGRHVHACGISSRRLEISPPGGVEVRGDE